MSEFRTGIGLSILATAVFAAGCTGESRTEPRPFTSNNPTPAVSEAPRIGLEVEPCAAKLGAFVFAVDRGDKTVTCEVSWKAKQIIDGQQEMNILNSSFRMRNGVCIVRPLLIEEGGVEYIGAARVGKDGTAEVVTIKPDPLRNGRGPVEKNILQPSDGKYQTISDGEVTTAAESIDPDKCSFPLWLY